jgi:hypothetical protein
VKSVKYKNRRQWTGYLLYISVILSVLKSSQANKLGGENVQILQKNWKVVFGQKCWAMARVSNFILQEII